MIQLSPRTDAKLAARGYRIDLHRHFVRSLSRPARQWRKLYHATKRLCELSVPTFGFTTLNFSMVGGYTEDLETLSKLGGGLLHVYGRLPRTIRYNDFISSLLLLHTPTHLVDLQWTKRQTVSPHDDSLYVELILIVAPPLPSIVHM